jgi:hydrophobe/amphiphile efflux-3 (HAE3) family protein
VSSRFFAQVGVWVPRARWLLLLGVAVVSVFLAGRLGDLHFDMSNEAWLIEGDDTLRTLEEFKAIFGNDDFVYILYDTADFFRREPIRRFASLAEALEAEVPHLLDMTWLGNAEWIEGRADSVEVEPLMGPLPETADELARVRELALSEPTYVDNLISADGKVAGLMLEMDLYPDGEVDPRKDVPPAVREVLARPEHADLHTVAAGGPILDYDIDVLSATEARDLGVLCLLVQIAVLFWVGRGARAVVVPAVVVVLSVLWTFGAIAIFGFKLNLTVIMVPVLLICVGIGDSLHVIAEFQDQQRRGLARREALSQGMALVGWPCVLTSLTTAAGFLSFLTADIRPFQDMGMYASLGVVLAVLLTFFLVPALYSWGPELPSSRSVGLEKAADAAPEDGPQDLFDRILGASARLVATRPRTLLLVFCSILAVSVVGLRDLQVESNAIKMFSPSVPIRHAYDWIDARMGGSMSLEIMLDTGRPNGALDPDFLKGMDALDRFLVEHPLITKTTSMLDVLRKMRKAFNENRPDFYDIPETKEEASQFMLLYEMSGGEERAKLLSFDGDIARMTVRTRSLGTAGTREIAADVEGFAAEQFGDSVRVELTGMAAWVRAMDDLINQGQRQSFTAAVVAISLMMMLVLRSVRLGLISMLPNVFPVLLTLGLMGWMGLRMDIMMMTFSALIIGVAVDDTIHFFVRFRREFACLGRYAPAIEATLTTVGRPITFTTLTLTLGFMVFAASDVTALVRFGTLSSFAFGWALLTDFFLAPALLILLEPLGPERAPNVD